MKNSYKTAFWLTLTLLLFALFRWLFGIGIPTIALPFAVGTTAVIVAGLATGRFLSKLAIRLVETNWTAVIVALIMFVVVGLVGIAFLLNAMIAETTLFPFSLTVLSLFLVMAATGACITITREQYKKTVLSTQAAAAQSKSELQLLQSQLSPHFLFNTLNNLYGLSLTEPQRVPTLILKLSELLRYSVYDAKDVFVPLQHEADYLRNYIDFEQIRLGERLTLTVEIQTVYDAGCKIPPLLLVVFVENAFKHARNTSDEKIRISISLLQSEKSIIFSAINSRGDAHLAHPEKHSGFGLDSVKKRLQLLYAGKHTLEVRQTAHEYAVKLELY